MSRKFDVYRMRFVLANSEVKPARCAYLTSSRLSARTVTTLLEPKGLYVQIFSNLDDLLNEMNFQHYPVVMLDSEFTGGTWEEAVKLLSARHPNVCSVVISDKPGEPDWEKVILAGGYDAVSLNRLAEDLTPAVQSARDCAQICGDEVASRNRQAALMAAVREAVMDMRQYDA